MTKAKLTVESLNHVMTHAVWGYRPGRCSRGLGRFVTQVNGHIKMLHGCRQPSLKRLRVSYVWMPPSGVCTAIQILAHQMQFSYLRRQLKIGLMTTCYILQECYSHVSTTRETRQTYTAT